jgi:hypothetical protein
VIIFLITVMVICAMSLLIMAVLDGRDAYRTRRNERAFIERQKRVAERRLHDISSRAFESMMDATRSQSVSADSDWPA